MYVADTLLPLLQVVMDVLGVAITCVVCTLILDPGIRPSLHHPVAAHLPAAGLAVANHT
jgi:hypothetical protein